MEACPAKAAPSGWQRGAYLYSHGEEPACWLPDGEVSQLLSRPTPPDTQAITLEPGSGS